MQQSFRMAQSVGCRVLKALKPVFLVYKDVKRMDFGTEERFLAKERRLQPPKFIHRFRFFIECGLTVTHGRACGCK